MPPIQFDFTAHDIFEQLAALTPGLRTPIRVVNPALAHQLRTQAGLPVATDDQIPTTYLDNTASTHALPTVIAAIEATRYFYANTHATKYKAAELTTNWYADSHQAMLTFFGANPQTHLAIFNGSGATGPLNMLAHHLFRINPNKKKPLFIYGEDAHHANMLPGRGLIHPGNAIPVLVDPQTGLLNRHHLYQLLEQHKGKIRLVALTGASNVTGLTYNWSEIAQKVHLAGAHLLVDAAQLAAHQAINMAEAGIDFLVAAGHKAYAPGSPGVLIMPKNLAPSKPHIHGGGNVKAVSLDKVVHTSNQHSDFYEAGTPDPFGAIALMTSLSTLAAIGMNRVWEHEKHLVNLLLQGLEAISGVKVYGTTESERVGVAAFNIKGWDHNLVASILSDYFGIATRNGCFCAHPLVSKLMGIDQADLIRQMNEIEANGGIKPGMVRASLGVYTSEPEVRYFISAVEYISTHNELREAYYLANDGNYKLVDTHFTAVDSALVNPLAAAGLFNPAVNPLMAGFH